MSGYDWNAPTHDDVEREARQSAERPPRVRAEDVLAPAELEDYYAGGGR